MAIVTAILVSMVVAMLGIVVIGLSLHNTSSSSLDRKRVDAVDAAEAGINVTMSSLRNIPTASLPCPGDPSLTGTLNTSPVSQYTVTPYYYDTYPPSTPALSCAAARALTLGPAGMLLVSKGTAVLSGSPTAVSRTMETELKLTPVFGGLGQAVFSDKVLDFQNKFTINGNVSNDGDVYTNGNYSMGNNTTIGGSVFAQGYASISQGTVNRNIWANNYVDLHNISVFGNVTASTSYISLGTAHVYGNAKAGTSLTIANNSQVDGSKATNSVSGPPPQISLPQITWNAQIENYWVTQRQYVSNHFTDCSLAKSFITGLSDSAAHLVVIDSPCALSFSSSDKEVDLKNNLAIVTAGSFQTSNNMTFLGVGGTWTMHIIVPYPQSCSPPTASPQDISVSNQTSFTNLKLFVYTPCTVNFGNNNAGGVNGQIIGGQVNITNQMVLNYRPIEVPGFNLTGYTASVAYVREVINGSTG